MTIPQNRGMWASVFVVGLVAVAAGSGTFAYFSDTETSQDNLIAAGTLDLTPDSTSLASASVSDAPPGAEVGQHTYTLSNAGSLNGDHLEVDASNLADSDGGGDVTADGFAQQLHLTTFDWKGDSVTAALPGATTVDVDDDSTDGVTVEDEDPGLDSSRDGVIHITSDGASSGDYAFAMVDVSSAGATPSTVSTFQFDFYEGSSNDGPGVDEIWIAIEDQDGDRHLLFKNPNDDTDTDDSGTWETYDASGHMSGTWYAIDAENNCDTTGVDLQSEFGDADIQAVGVARGSPCSGGTTSSVYYDNLDFESVSADFPHEAPTLSALETYGLDNLAGLNSGGDSGDLDVGYTLDAEVGNDFQDEGVLFDLVFTLNQDASQ